VSDHSEFNRREILQRCVALGSLTLIGSNASAAMLLAFQEKEVRKPTPPDDLGPFYKKRAPEGSMLRAAGDPGMPLSVSGEIFDTRGEKLSNATIEIWQADHLGRYDLNGYRYRAKLSPDSSSGYKFETMMPGHYPDRVCQHIHYLVIAPGHKPLVTQLYFATDPVFEGDPDKNFNRDPLIRNRELVRPVTLVGDPKDIHAAVKFELCLERL
jgi:hydroxyquinol 1,2-dioxygenase